jgi:tripartite-type tricarboxylate transporter receptor subunit TctC
MPRLTRRSLVLGAVAAPFVVRAGVAQAQAWPPGTIRIVVPYPPGGSTDVIARIVQTGMQQRLGANVIVENKPGASGSIGTDLVAKSPKDGTTWLIAFDNHAANPFVLPKLPFDTEKDLDPVYWVGTAPYVIATQTEKPYKSLADVFAAAKARPGKINYASVGSGSIGHLAVVLLAKKAGVELVHVPYRGGGPAINDVMAGHVELLVGSIALSMPQIAAGKLRAVTQMGQARAAALHDIPTVAESGFPDIVADAWWGFFAPAGTPKSMVDSFRAETNAMLSEEKIAKQLSESQQVHFVRGGPEELRKFLHEQMRVWGAVVRENGITGESG